MSVPKKLMEATDYSARVTRQIPGLRDMHQMAGILLAEQVPSAGRVLVLGAGGGMELSAFARTYPGWHFDGVDPDADMLAQAREETSEFSDRVTLHQGYVEDAPEVQFDGAACLLTLHFFDRAKRVQTLSEIHKRLAQGAPLVVAHHSFSQTEPQPDIWLRRYFAFMAINGAPAPNREKSLETMKSRLPVLSPEEDEACLHEAGFDDVQLFYAGFTFKGWVAFRR